MLKNLIKKSFSIVAGKPAEDLSDFLDYNKYINEFLIAKKLDFTVNYTRNLLYRLADNGLVSSTRKKDKQKGWYTYFWKIEVMKSLIYLKNNLLKKIENLENQLNSRKTKVFYFCERCNVEISEENALFYNFICNECGSIFILKDNSKFINNLSKSIEKLREEEEKINLEISNEEEKKNKKIEREIKKEKKEKELLKKEKALKRLKEKKEKEKKSTSKKIKEKKPTKKLSEKKPTKKPINKKPIVKKSNSKKIKEKKPTKKPLKKTINKKSVVKKLKLKRLIKKSK